jgi:hypothetical protein
MSTEGTDHTDLREPLDDLSAGYREVFVRLECPLPYEPNPDHIAAMTDPTRTERNRRNHARGTSS